MKYHPDKNPDDEDAVAKFHDINDAYEVLQDEDSKEIYDRHGEEGLKNKGHHGSDVFRYAVYHSGGGNLAWGHAGN